MSLTYFLALLTLTNSFAFNTQMSDIRKMFKTDLNYTYRVDATFIENEDSIGADFEELRAFVNLRENLIYGAFESMDVYFDELENNAEFIELNGKLRGDVPFEKWLSAAETIFVDPEIFEILEFDLSSSDFLPVENNGEIYLPIFAGKKLEGVVSKGDVLTLNNIGERYIIAGFYDGARWLNDNDPVTQPPLSTEYGFIAPFSEMEKQIPQYHNMSRHSTVGTTFLNCPPDVAEEFKNRAAEMGIKFKVASMEDFINDYSEMNEELLNELLFLAVLVSLCSEISIISVLCVNVLLKKREYGIKIAFGGTMNGIIFSLGIELFLLNLISGIIGFAAAYHSFLGNMIDSIRDINLRTLVQSSLPCLLIPIIFSVILVILIPAMLLRRYDPAILVKEEE
ncbi:MAG: ABC transporter permease [Lachnospiraceae bacterium]|nr:ABC transporter permease [Lachnospiraceae bacterium]